MVYGGGVLYVLGSGFIVLDGAEAPRFRIRGMT